jgi:hypothetical protein
VFRLPTTDTRVCDRLGGFLCYRADSKKVPAEWDGESSTINRLALQARRAPTLPFRRGEPRGNTFKGSPS